MKEKLRVEMSHRAELSRLHLQIIELTKKAALLELVEVADPVLVEKCRAILVKLSTPPDDKNYT